MYMCYKERYDIAPICPHCKKELKTVNFQQVKGDLGKRCIYFCSECQAILGLSHRKGLTFGI